jgi:lysozyme
MENDLEKINKLYAEDIMQESIASKLGALGVAAGLGYAASQSGIDQKAVAALNPDSKPQVTQATGPTSQSVSKFVNELRGMLKKHEGVERKAYKDTRGILTIGVGYNLTNPSAKADLTAAGIDYKKAVRGAPLSDNQIDDLLHISMKRAVHDAQRFFPKFWQLPYDAQLVVADMSFNLGLNKLNKFEKFKTALEKGDWDEAANQMKDSNWYRQVGNRSKALVNMIRGI